LAKNVAKMVNEKITGRERYHTVIKALFPIFKPKTTERMKKPKNSFIISFWL
jgi:hypothetical protein